MTQPAIQPTEPTEPGTPEIARDHDWQRLDPRMLLVHPIRELLRFLPVLLGLFIAGSASDSGAPWHYVGVAVPILLGVLRYVTTRFRVADGRVELRRGLISRHVLSTPLDRVRTVDLTASPIHRLLGVTTLRIGTGTTGGDDSDRLDLDGLPVGRAHELRRELLHVAVPPMAAGDAGQPGQPWQPVPPAAPPIVSFDLSWLRFAPFTSGGLVVAAATFGAISQLLNILGAWDDVDDAASTPAAVAAPAIAIVFGLVLLVVVVAVLAMAGYLVTNWDFRLTRSDGSWHVGRGLLTKRETSLDESRVAGVCLVEPLLLRAARGRALSAIVTGVDLKTAGSSVLVPPSPSVLAPYVAGVVLGTDAPMTAPLRDHGPAAHRRRWTRALMLPVLLLIAAAVLAVTVGPWWLPLPVLLLVGAAAGIARDRVAGLGHTLVDGYVVARSGSLARHRVALSVDDVIGWNLRATWFQRRVGLTTLVATTAGGGGSVTVPDVAAGDAVRLAGDALPGLVAQFYGPPSASGVGSANPVG